MRVLMRMLEIDKLSCCSRFRAFDFDNLGLYTALYILQKYIF